MVLNRAEVIGHGNSKLREVALSIVEAAIGQGDPAAGTRAKVRLDGNVLWVDGQEYDLGAVGRIWVVGAGKASIGIAQALEEILGPRIAGGVIVVKKGETRRLRRLEVIEAGHPVPDSESIRGARKVLDVASRAAEGDIVFAAVTGGSSSLAVLPPEGVSLSDLRILNELLLRCGAPINVINVVRRHICLLNGGRLVAAVQPARAITLSLDTAPEGMPWPDKCLPDPTTFADAIAMLKEYALWDRTPETVRAYFSHGLDHPELETVKDMSAMKTRMVFVGDPVSICDAAARRAAELGFAPMVLGTYLEGEARDVAICMAGIAREVIERSRPINPPCALISGGETTVTITEAAGGGGPNQEFALSFALKMGQRSPYACASVDTDGTDGPTDVAGGLVDDATLGQARAADIDLGAVVRNHASTEALTRLGSAVRTGHTGTNLQNIRVVVIGT